jgi:glycine cleavage system H lipoate-binding protein
MKCPFLRDARVKFCEASAFRKMILEGSSSAVSERCSTPAFADCPDAAARTESLPDQQFCPWLHESHAEFCAAAAVTKLIPATNDLLSRCKTDSHLYCELYLAHADPMGERKPEPRSSRVGERTPRVEGIPVPANLSYAPNHLWIDIAEDGYCHVGIDGFLATVIGTPERISFANHRFVGRPTAVVTVNGADLQLAFPNEIHGIAANCYLRTHPEKLTDDPYGAGWLFEGLEPRPVRGSAAASARDGLLEGEEAVQWMREECDRLTQFVHECVARPDAESGVSFMADGGRVAPGIAAHLERQDLINLFTEFFAPRPGWRR